MLTPPLKPYFSCSSPLQIPPALLPDKKWAVPKVYSSLLENNDTQHLQGLQSDGTET